MWNAVSNGVNTLTNTAVALVLGYGPNQTAPPEVLVQNLAAGGTVTLPKINQVPPTAPGTPGTSPGCGDGFPLIIKNIAQFPTTITAASGDTTDVALLANNGDSIILVSDAPNSKWRAVSAGGGAGSVTAIVSTAVASTIAATTRYQVVTAAAAVTVPAPVASAIGQLYTVTNTSGGSVTVTPASGTIQGLAAITIATVKAISYFTDGTNFFLAAS